MRTVPRLRRPYPPPWMDASHAIVYACVGVLWLAVLWSKWRDGRRQRKSYTASVCFVCSALLVWGLALLLLRSIKGQDIERTPEQTRMGRCMCKSSGWVVESASYKVNPLDPLCDDGEDEGRGSCGIGPDGTVPCTLAAKDVCHRTGEYDGSPTARVVHYARRVRQQCCETGSILAHSRGGVLGSPLLWLTLM
eukprot:COSAG05_NODE_1984_length_3746_cov_3.101430_3_plen_192_part_01